jgi:hypothetical protein
MWEWVWSHVFTDVFRTTLNTACVLHLLPLLVQVQGEQSVAVPLTMSKKDRGQLHLQVKWSPCVMPVSPFMGGPVRYREHMSPLAGALLGAWQDDNSLQFCTYKLYLLNIEVGWDWQAASASPAMG